VSAAEFRHWLERHHAGVAALLVGFYKKHTGQPSVTYHEALDEALAFGWIDGVRKRIDDERYSVRFTPRQPRSIWSAVNIRRVGELTKLGRMAPPGLKAFESRDPARAGLYSFENRPQQLPRPLTAMFRKDANAWAFFQAQPPGYRRTAIWWIVSAKKEETRLRRLAALIELSRRSRRLPMLTPVKT